MLRIAIQKKGRMRQPSLGYLKSLDIKIPGPSSSMIQKCQNADLEILYVRNSDIPIYVQYGVADFGIVGQNVLIEGSYRFPKLKKLEFGKCSLILAAPQSKQDLQGERIATSYPNSLKKYLKDQKIQASIVNIKGAVEISPTLNLSDAICDITQTGNTLKENNLKIIDKIFDSQACLISNLTTNNPNYEEILRSTIR